MLARAAGLLAEVDQRIRGLITLAYAVCADETPLRVGPKKPKPAPVPPGSYPSALIIVMTDGQTTTGPDPVDAAKQANRPLIERAGNSAHRRGEILQL